MAKSKEKKKMPFLARLAIVIIIAFTAFLVFAIMQGDNTTSTTSTTSAQNTDSTKTSEVNYIVDNSTISAEFVGFENHPELDMFTTTLRVTNKTEQPIWVYLDSASVNDEMMQMVMSGVPLYIEPGKRGSNGFIFYFKQISIDSFDDVNTVSFKLKVANKDTMNEIWTSPEITLTK